MTRLIHANCEDYRAGASIDMEHDEEDLKRKILCPVLALWGERGAVHRMFDNAGCLAGTRRQCERQAFAWKAFLAGRNTGRDTSRIADVP